MKSLHTLHIIVTAKVSKAKGKPPNVPLEKIDSSYAILIGDRSNSHTPPFILTFEIFNKNFHNCLVDSGASSNIMPYSVCLKLNISPHKSVVQIV